MSFSPNKTLPLVCCDLNGERVGVLLATSWQREHRAVTPQNIRSVESVKANPDIKTTNKKHSWLCLGVARFSNIHKFLANLGITEF